MGEFAFTASSTLQELLFPWKVHAWLWQRGLFNSQSEITEISIDACMLNLEDVSHSMTFHTRFWLISKCMSLCNDQCCVLLLRYMSHFAGTIKSGDAGWHPNWSCIYFVLICKYLSLSNIIKGNKCYVSWFDKNCSVAFFPGHRLSRVFQTLLD